MNSRLFIEHLQCVRHREDVISINNSHNDSTKYHFYFYRLKNKQQKTETVSSETVTWPKPYKLLSGTVGICTQVSQTANSEFFYFTTLPPIKSNIINFSSFPHSFLFLCIDCLGIWCNWTITMYSPVWKPLFLSMPIHAYAGLEQRQRLLSDS